MTTSVNLNKEMIKWKPLMEKLGVTDPSKQAWLAEYAAYHNIYQSQNESVAYAQGTNVSGMGAVVAPTVSTIPGQTYGGTGTVGSGDYGQQLLPVAMKVAAHTIGLDLVAVKPTPGPVIDLMYVDYRYDDGDTTDASYKPVVFKIAGDDTNGTNLVSKLVTDIRALFATAGVTEIQGGLNKRMFFNLAANTAGAGNTINTDTTVRSVGNNVTDYLTEPASKEGVIEFLGFSRIDKQPMFRAYRTTNTTPQGIWRFDKQKNTFGETESVVDAFEYQNGSTAGSALNPANKTIGFGLNGTGAGNVKVELISALEDHIFGFVTGGSLNSMRREEEEKTYGGIIAPAVQTKRIAVGTIEVTSALRLTEIEDIKAQTGIDIVSKLEAVLVNELSQTISKEIVNKIFAFGELNRKTAPGYSAVADAAGTPAGIFDFDVDAYLTGSAPGGETSQSLQRKLVSKVKGAQSFIATDGRVGPGTFIVCSGSMSMALTEGTTYELSKESGSASAPGQLYPAGKVAGMTIYVDPYMPYNDKRIVVGRKNNPDQPGIVFVPYLMAQSVKLISEATFAPRMLLRSRYAVAEVGFFPYKQYLQINVKDNLNRLN